MLTPLARFARVATLTLAGLVATPAASALQPLSDFLEHARTFNPDHRVAVALVGQREAEVDAATGGLLPGISATASYTRNQHEVDSSSLFSNLDGVPASFRSLVGELPNSILQPQDQLDATVTLMVPIFNLGAWDGRRAAKAALEAGRADEADAQASVEREITRVYFQLLAAQAVAASAGTYHELAARTLRLARDKKAAGLGPELDVQRALAADAKASQSVTTAELGIATLRHALVTLSGVDPEPAVGFPADDLHEEAPLDSWQRRVPNVPVVKSAVAAREAAEHAAGQARAAWLPTVQGLATERFTNATGFTGGYSDFFLLQIVASWHLDASVPAQVRAQQAALLASRAREDKARLGTEDAIFRDYTQVRAWIEASRSARVQESAAELAASLAEDRYAGGMAPELDAVQGRQGAFDARVARVQADMELAYARAALRIDCAMGGQP
jgi:outer membrane protein TolC